jgi:hypothetical protein
MGGLHEAGAQGKGGRLTLTSTVNWVAKSYYLRSNLSDYGLWRFQRKHFRAELSNGAFVKLNGRRARLDAKDLQKLAVRIVPKHLFMSVLDYLFPERVSDKSRLDTYPVGGELVVDIDSYLFRRPHTHSFDNHSVCEGCLEVSQRLTLQVADEIRRYYSNLAVVFSGRRGFHLHVLDFQARDWARYEPMNPLQSHAAARFRFLKLIEPATLAFDRIHFTVSVDPLRVISVPGSFNAESGLACTFIGWATDLEAKSVRSILERSAFTVAPTPTWGMRQKR